MVMHECWIVAELAESGDPELVRETVLDAESDLEEATVEADCVVFHGWYGGFDRFKSTFASLGDHLDRLVFVACLDGGMGATVSEYYADADDLAEPTDSLGEDSVLRNWASMHFDHYAAHYDVHAGI